MRHCTTGSGPHGAAARAGIVIALLSIVALASTSAAGKTDEDAFETVKGTGNWEHTIDVSELEPGKYNILVRARDRAGNEALGGPFNVFVDPASDEPAVSISYPVVNQAVGERLYIIGTAVDDDAVGRIEIRVDDRQPITAEGTDYWSAFVSMGSLDDGPHTITATAFDVNGTEGAPVSVSVNLDTTAPTSLTESHDSGVLISKKTTIDGVVEDANGVDALELITGSGSRPLRLSGRDDQRKEFEFDIDPRNLEEGAVVWWLRSVDRTGSTSVTPFLFFVDTSPPELEVLTPLEDDVVDGRLHFVGRASDAVRLASLTYELSSGESGEIDLIPGNPYWSLDVDLGPEPGRSLTAEFRVEDTAGNTESVRMRYSIDTEYDEPELRLSWPPEAAVLDHVTLVGHILDDDGAAAVRYSVDGQTPAEAESAGAFSIPVTGLAPGNHEIRLTPVDIYGRAGQEIRRRFTVATPPARISLDAVLVGEQSTDYEPGFALAAGERAALSGSVSGDYLPARVEYRVGGQIGRANVGENGIFSISLPRGDVGTAVPIDVWHATATGKVSRTVGFYVQLPPVPEPTVDEAGNETPGPEPTIADVLSPGLYLGPEVAPDALAGVEVSAETEAALEAPILLPSGSTLQLRAVGGDASEPEVSGVAEDESEGSPYSVRAAGTLVTVSATRDAYVDTLRVAASVSGRTVTSPPFAVTGELEDPTITAEAALVGAWAGQSTQVPVTVEDPAGISQVRVRLVAPSAAEATESEATETRWAGAEPAQDGIYIVPLELGAQDGPFTAEVEAQDRTGRLQTLRIPFFVDRENPGVDRLTPPEGASVNGTVSVIARLSEPATTTAITATAGDQRTDLPVDETVVVTFSATAELNEVTFELTDRAGNRGTTTIALSVDEAGDRPTLQLQVPEEGGVVREEFRISGVLLDDDKPERIRYTVDGGEPREVATTGVFDIAAPMEALEDGEHTLEVTGLDSGGTESETVRRTFVVSRTEPVSSVTEPTIEDYLSGTIHIVGSSEDPNGIVSVHISTDNGGSFQRAQMMRVPDAADPDQPTDGEAQGAESETAAAWEYRLDTTQVEDGTHSVLVRAEDGAQTVGLFTSTINIDNTPPILELTQPGDGDSVSGSFTIDGRSDDSAPAEVRLVAQPLSYDGNGSTPEITGEEMVLATFDQPGPFAYVVDASNILPGWFNLRVEAEDRAGNTSRVSRNIHVEPPALTSNPEIHSPADGTALSHQFQVTASTPFPGSSLTLLVDGQPLEVLQTDVTGHGSVVIEPGTLSEGDHELRLRAEPAGAEEPLFSEMTRISYTELGPWLVIDEPANESYIRNRPFLTGRAGYALELDEGEDRAVRDANERLLRNHALERVEVSMDNGRSYQVASGTEKWRYRIETTEIPDGPVYLVVRASFADGSSAVTRHTLSIDETPPQVRLLQPQERDAFDESVPIVGVTTDDNALRDVAVVLREGDKSRYSVPSFVQGLYIDAHALGATYFDLGAGLTFFDDNVRLQAQIGVSPPGRFSGLVIGAKLLANVFSFPASFIFGPDLEWLSAAIAIGANFSYFTMSDDTIGFTEEGLVLAGMVAQLEFPRIELASMPVFNTFGFYTEGQLWFISSDVEAGTAFRLGFGIRTNVF